MSEACEQYIVCGPKGEVYQISWYCLIVLKISYSAADTGPDRTTSTGQLIDAYLQRNFQQEDHAIHLLFAANRWEAIDGLKRDLHQGTTLIVDRYSFSGAVYSAAKQNASLSLDWAWSPEIGLLKPDLVLFLNVSPADAAKRGNYGQERYETNEMQDRVRQMFKQLFAQLPEVKVYEIDAGNGLEVVASQIQDVYLKHDSMKSGTNTPLEALARLQST